MRRAPAWAALVVLAIAPGCGGSTNLVAIEYPLTARSASGPAFVVGDWTVELTDGRLGFGPLYLCASRSASPELCETAVAEFTEVTTVDVLAAAPLTLGRVHGLSDVARTALFDYGTTWRAGAAPLVSPQAPDGHALVMSGTAQTGATVVRFEILLDLAPQQPASHVALARIPEHLQSDDTRLELVFDPRRWLAGVDFAALAALGQTSVTVRLGDPAASAVATALTSTALPTFTWLGSP